ncbi:MAG: NAD(P)H-hydrate dehydratase [Bacteroidota bacterium]|nr:NAD(P)H-hydrate dehydratase [Bacteroidota bacterium]
MKSLESYLSGFHSAFTFFDKNSALSIYKPRDPFANKGNFGHALILAGSFGKIGAAILAAKACLSAGSGLLTVYCPACGYEIMQTSVPEAMVLVDDYEFHLTTYPSKLDTYNAAGLGPGIGTNNETAYMIKNFLISFRKPLVLDADALNIISNSPELLSSVQPDTIITPHPKEFDRLFGKSTNDIARFEKAKKMAIQYKIIIVLKGHFTGVFNPDGSISFNTSGNAGLAKGGSGDALTGIITALLAQSYKPAAAAALGVYMHGYAGDLAAGLYSQEAMLPTDLIHCLGKTFLEWKEGKEKT